MVPSIKVRSEEDDVDKPAVVGIAIAATVVVVLLVVGLVYCLIRWRRKSSKNVDSRYGQASSVDLEHVISNDSTSKVPLIRHHERPIPEQAYSPPLTTQRDISDENANAVSPPRPQRVMSGSTIQSLPPSYAVATETSQNSRRGSPERARPSHTRIGSGGLRPLMLVEEQRNETAGSRSGSPENRDQPISQQRAVRPRASSRFHEEGLEL